MVFARHQLQGLMIAALALAVMVSGKAAYADCSDPTGVAGALVYNSDFAVVQFCNGTNWVGTANAAASQIMVVEDQKADGTNGGTSVTGAQTRTLNTTVLNTINGASLNTGTNEVTLPAGTYKVTGFTTGYVAGGLQARLVTGSTTLLSGNFVYISASSGTTYFQVASNIEGMITLASTTLVKLEMFAGAGVATNGLGVASTPAWGNEVYSRLVFEKMA